MYTPELFRERDVHRLHDLIDAHPFGALLATRDDGSIEIAHVPFVLDRGAAPNGRLRVHVSRANPIAKLAAAGRPLVAMFSGPHGYVSASWYGKPHAQVPTWNYAVVHAHGRAAGEMPKDELHQLLTDLAVIHEGDSATPWRIGDVNPAFVDELMREIEGFAIPIERLDGKFKLSQNRSAADKARVVQALARRGGPDDVAMVSLMR